MNIKEVLVHIRVYLMITGDEEYKNKLINAYKSFTVKEKELYEKTHNPFTDLGFYELTYFDKIKDPKYLEMIMIESDILKRCVKGKSK